MLNRIVLNVLLLNLTLSYPAYSIPAAPDSAVLRSLVDKKRDRAYALLPGGVDVLELGTRRKLAHIALREWTWAGPKFACPPGMALSPEGDIVVSSNVVPVVWRVDRRSLQVSVHELVLKQEHPREVGFSALAWSEKRQGYVAQTDQGERWLVGRELKDAWRISGTRSQPRRCG